MTARMRRASAQLGSEKNENIASCCNEHRNVLPRRLLLLGLPLFELAHDRREVLERRRPRPGSGAETSSPPSRTSATPSPHADRSGGGGTCEGGCPPLSSAATRGAIPPPS